MGNENMIAVGSHQAAGKASAEYAAGIASIDSFQFKELDAETLLAYCGTQMRELDADVRRIFAGQQHRKRIGEALTQLSNAIARHSEGIVHGNKDQAKKEIDEGFARAIEVAGPDTELGKQLQAAKNGFDANVAHQGGKDDAFMSGSEMKQLGDTIGRFSTDLSTGRELDMLDLQKLMSARQQVVQLTTSVMQKLHDMQMAAIANINK